MAGLVADDVEKNVLDNHEVDVVKEDNPNPKNIEVTKLEDSDLKVPEEDDAEAASQSSHHFASKRSLRERS